MKPLTDAQRANIRLQESELPRRTVERQAKEGRQGSKAHVTPLLRQRALDMRRRGVSLKDTSEATGLSTRTIARITQHKIKRRGSYGKRR